MTLAFSYNSSWKHLNIIIKTCRLYGFPWLSHPLFLSLSQSVPIIISHFVQILYIAFSVCTALIYVFTQPLHTRSMRHKDNFYANFNRFELWVFLLQDRLLKNSFYPTILPIARDRIVRFIPFPIILALCEMKTD